MKNQDLIKMFNDAFKASGDCYGSETLYYINWSTFSRADVHTYGAGGCQVVVRGKQNAPYSFTGYCWLKVVDGKLLYNWECKFPKYVIPDDGSKFYKWLYDKTASLQGIVDKITINNVTPIDVDRKIESVHYTVNNEKYIHIFNVYKKDIVDILNELHPECEWDIKPREIFNCLIPCITYNPQYEVCMNFIEGNLIIHISKE